MFGKCLNDPRGQTRILPKRRTDLDRRRPRDKKLSRIVYAMPDGGYRDDEEQEWSRIQVNMIDAMNRLEKAFRSHIRKLH